MAPGLLISSARPRRRPWPARKDPGPMSGRKAAGLTRRFSVSSFAEELVLGEFAEVGRLPDAAAQAVHHFGLVAKRPAFRADRKRHLLARFRQPSSDPRSAHRILRPRRSRPPPPAGCAADFSGKEIRLADKIRDNFCAGFPVNILGRPDLRDAAAFENRHPVRDRERLLLVVGHVNRGQPEFLAGPPDFRAHLEAELGVEVREGARRAAGSAGGSPAPARVRPAAAGRPRAARFCVRHTATSGPTRAPRHALLDFRRRDPALLEPERGHSFRRSCAAKRVALEHHPVFRLWGGSFVTSSSPKRIRPESGMENPRRRSAAGFVFPQPLGPGRKNNSPRLDPETGRPPARRCRRIFLTRFSMVMENHFRIGAAKGHPCSAAAARTHQNFRTAPPVLGAGIASEGECLSREGRPCSLAAAEVQLSQEVV